MGHVTSLISSPLLFMAPTVLRPKNQHGLQGPHQRPAFQPGMAPLQRQAARLAPPPGRLPRPRRCPSLRCAPCPHSGWYSVSASHLAARDNPPRPQARHITSWVLANTACRTVPFSFSLQAQMASAGGTPSPRLLPPASLTRLCCSCTVAAAGCWVSLQRAQGGRQPHPRPPHQPQWLEPLTTL